ncbi:MAG: hypothetical protein QOJ69_1571 [Actinomycetota bacterium]|jgi:YVTN family beta-propeller protein|nr:hypothetical protein [Actinomycetota bacterium]
MVALRMNGRKAVVLTMALALAISIATVVEFDGVTVDSGGPRAPGRGPGSVLRPNPALSQRAGPLVALPGEPDGTVVETPGAAEQPAAPVETTVPAPEPEPQGIYSHTQGPGLSAAVADIPVRVYVPNSGARTVSIIDPATLEVVDTLPVGKVPHHITPSWDLSKLYVNNTEGDSLSVIDPRTGKVSDTIPVVDPYNLYFTPDGKKAIVVAERFQRLDFYDIGSWQLVKSLSVPWAGVDHADFTLDGRYFLASTEFSGQVVKVDTETMEIVGRATVGSLPIDVKSSPDGSVFYVSNQGRHGVSIVDPTSMEEIGFLPTGKGAHGLNVSRDAKLMYVSNRLGGSISVIDLATRQVAATWQVGGSPDMLQVSADGKQLWASNRYHGSVSVIDTATGTVIKTIATGAGAHGLTLFPQPGRYSIGHNGVYR